MTIKNKEFLRLMKKEGLEKLILKKVMDIFGYGQMMIIGAIKY